MCIIMQLQYIKQRQIFLNFSTAFNQVLNNMVATAKQCAYTRVIYDVFSRLQKLKSIWTVYIFIYSVD